MPHLHRLAGVEQEMHPEGAAKLNLDVRFPSKQGGTTTVQGNNTLVLCGQVSDNQLKYASYLTVVPEGGTVTGSGNKLTVSNADAITVYVSAATGKGLDEMVQRAAELLRELPPMLVYECEYEPEDAYVGGGKETTIRRENDTFYVEGEWLFNLCGQVNFEDYESLNFFQRVLKKSGVFELLEQKGCTDGMTVCIYDFEFDYVK